MEGLKTETLHRGAAPKETTEPKLECTEGTRMNNNASAAELAAPFMSGASEAVLARAEEAGERLRKALEEAPAWPAPWWKRVK